MATEHVHLSASSFLKALKATSDPPEIGGPTKIELANRVWERSDIYIPRKAEAIRDWVLDCWTRVKPSVHPNALLDTAYYRLLLEVLPDCPQPVQPPLPLLSTFFSSLEAHPSFATGLIRDAGQLLPALYAGSRTTAVKAEAWVEVWVNMTSFLASTVPSAEPRDRQGLMELVDLVDDRLEEVLRVYQNGKKIAQVLTRTLTTGARALSNYPSLERKLVPLIASLLFPSSVLQAGNAFKPVIDAFGSPSDPSPELQLLPQLFQSYIAFIHRLRFELFDQPSSSRLSYDVFVANKVRSTVRDALLLALKWIGRLEADGPMFSAIAWAARHGLWSAIRTWGGYVETETAWGDIVQEQGRRGKEALVSNGFESPRSAESVLGVLLILEELDHRNAGADLDLVGWCIAAPANEHLAAESLLSKILQYFQLTRSLPTFYTLLDEALKRLLPTTLLDDVAMALYALISSGPLVREDFQGRLFTATRAANTTSLSWRHTVMDVATGMSLAATDFDITEIANPKKRKRAKRIITAATAATIAVRSRLLVILLHAASGVTLAMEDVTETLTTVAIACAVHPSWIVSASESGHDHNQPSQKMKFESSAPLGLERADWAYKTVISSRLRVLEAVDRLGERACAISHDMEEALINILENDNAEFESRLQSLSILLRRYSRPLTRGHPQSGVARFIDVLIKILGYKDTKGRTRQTERVSFVAAAWQLVEDVGLVFLNALASQGQIQCFWLAVMSALSHVDPAMHFEDLDLLATRRILQSSEVWELPQFQLVLSVIIADASRVLRQTGDSSSIRSIFGMLHFCPAAALSRVNRLELVDAAIFLDRHSTGPHRISLRTWLYRVLVETDNVASLTNDANVLLWLANVQEISDPASGKEHETATRTLLEAVYTRICHSPEASNAVLSVLLEDAIERHPCKDWPSPTEGGRSVSAALDLFSQSALLLCEVLIRVDKEEQYGDRARAGMLALSNMLLTNLRPAISTSRSRTSLVPEDMLVLGAWRVVINFRLWLDPSAPIIAVADNFLGKIVTVSKDVFADELHDLPVIILQIIGLEKKADATAYGCDKLLSAFVLLNSFQHNEVMDDAFKGILKSALSLNLHFQSLLGNLVDLLRNYRILGSSQELASIFHTLGLLIDLPVENSAKAIRQFLRSLLSAVNSLGQEQDLPIIMPILILIETIVEKRSRLLQAGDMSLILNIVLQVIVPSGWHPRVRTTRCDIFMRVISVMTISVRHRADLISSNLPSVALIMRTILPILQRPRSVPGQAKSVTLRMSGRWPQWISDNDRGLGGEEARAFGRLIVNLSSARLLSAKGSDTRPKQRTLAGPLAKHAPLILISYARAAADPVASLSSEVRRQLEPGIFILCDIMTSAGRADGRGREGEGIGLPFGLGEGIGGEAEREVWADVWRKWSRRRYVGQG